MNDFIRFICYGVAILALIMALRIGASYYDYRATLVQPVTIQQGR